jgi:hypothetical protein
VLLPIALLFSLGLARPVYLLNIYAWPLLEDLGREVARVTPEHGLVYASESILFTAKRLPAPGVENFLGLMLPLPPERLARLKIMPPSQVERWLADGRFHTVMIGTGDPRLEKLGLLQRYAHHRELYGFYLLSDPR